MHMFACCRVVLCHSLSLTTCLAGYSAKRCLSVPFWRRTACGIWRGGSASTFCAGAALGRMWMLGRICESQSAAGIWLVLSSRLRRRPVCQHWLDPLLTLQCSDECHISTFFTTIHLSTIDEHRAGFVLQLMFARSDDDFVDFCACTVCVCVCACVCNCLLWAVSSTVCCFMSVCVLREINTTRACKTVVHVVRHDVPHPSHDQSSCGPLCTRRKWMLL